MKKLFFMVFITTIFLSCKNNETKDVTVEMDDEIALNYVSIGDTLTDNGVLTKDQIAETYKNLKPGDTVAVKFTSKVNEVCQNKGCWMKMDLGEDETMVKFKDYGFFMPKDLAGEEVIVGGVAFVSEMSVEDQRHYAEDAGKSKEEIAAITEPKRTLSFISNGVLIPTKE